jgi:hypothetical protein
LTDVSTEIIHQTSHHVKLAKERRSAQGRATGYTNALPRQVLEFGMSPRQQASMIALSCIPAVFVTGVRAALWFVLLRAVDE